MRSLFIFLFVVLKNTTTRILATTTITYYGHTTTTIFNQCSYVVPLVLLQRRFVLGYTKQRLPLSSHLKPRTIVFNSIEKIIYNN